MDVFETKVLRVFLLAIHSHLYKRIFTPTPTPPPLNKVGLKLVCNVNIVQKSRISKTQRLCPETSMKLYVLEFGSSALINMLCTMCAFCTMYIVHLCKKRRTYSWLLIRGLIRNLQKLRHLNESLWQLDISQMWIFLRS